MTGDACQVFFCFLLHFSSSLQPVLNEFPASCSVSLTLSFSLSFSLSPLYFAWLARVKFFGRVLIQTHSIWVLSWTPSSLCFPPTLGFSLSLVVSFPPFLCYPRSCCVLCLFSRLFPRIEWCPCFDLSSCPSLIREKLSLLQQEVIKKLKGETDRETRGGDRQASKEEKEVEGREKRLFPFMTKKKREKKERKESKELASSLLSSQEESKTGWKINARGRAANVQYFISSLPLTWLVFLSLFLLSFLLINVLRVPRSHYLIKERRRRTWKTSRDKSNFCGQEARKGEAKRLRRWRDIVRWDKNKKIK